MKIQYSMFDKRTREYVTYNKDGEVIKRQSIAEKEQELANATRYCKLFQHEAALTLNTDNNKLPTDEDIWGDAK